MNTNTAAADPVLTAGVVRDYAADAGVCVRPLLRQVTDKETGSATGVIRCGSTREAKCPPCAQRARRLRMQQRAEGWHLEEDPLDEASADDDGLEGSVGDEVLGEGPDSDDPDGDPGDGDGGPDRRVRSTRRRTDAVDLPRVPQENRSVGRAFTAPNGITYRPSMFVTLTLGSYGKVVPGRKRRPRPWRGCTRRPGDL